MQVQFAWRSERFVSGGHRPEVQHVARPLVKPWRALDIIRVPLPTAEAAIAHPLPPMPEACSVSGAGGMTGRHRLCNPSRPVEGNWRIN